MSEPPEPPEPPGPPDLAQLLPTGVAVEQVIGAGSDDDLRGLFPEEAAHVVRAVDKRRREFAAARACARRALDRLGHPPVPIPSGERGAPVWPPGVVGSLTHCEGFVAAAAAPSAVLAALGVDAEPHAPLPDGVLRLVARSEEQVDVGQLAAARPDVHWDRLLFSAKEAVYKCWFPLTGRWLGFEEARITVDPSVDPTVDLASGTFEARLLVPGPVVDGRVVAGFAGRWAVAGGLVLTAVALARLSPPATSPAQGPGTSPDR